MTLLLHTANQGINKDFIQTGQYLYRQILLYHDVKMSNPQNFILTR